jgi:hypothetical protein
MMTYEEALEFVDVDPDKKLIHVKSPPETPAELFSLRCAISAVQRRFLLECLN